MREILDAIFYVVWTGCQWPLLSHEFPHWSTVYSWFRRWRLDGTWERLNRTQRRRSVACCPGAVTLRGTPLTLLGQGRAGMRDAEPLTVSMDLPFAQQRSCSATNVQHTTLSAHKNEQFGIDYGVLIKELRVLDRAGFVVGKDDTIRYAEYVMELSHEPDYGKALAAVRQAAAS